MCSADNDLLKNLTESFVTMSKIALFNPVKYSSSSESVIARFKFNLVEVSDALKGEISNGQ